MGACALGVMLLLQFLQGLIKVSKQVSKVVAFVDDFTISGKDEIKSYWGMPEQVGQRQYEYFPK